MEQVLLKDICKITMGQSPKSEFYRYSPEGIPFMQGCTTFGKFYPTIDTWTVQWNKEAQFNDILFTVRAPVGDINYAPCRMAIGRGLAAIHPIKIEREYLYYLLKYEKGKFLSKSNGSVYDAINIDTLSKMKLNIHDKESRQKIATLLNNYDVLIENNNSRIQALENTADSLFKEWFIRFRFPGHEKYGKKESELGKIPCCFDILKMNDVFEYYVGGGWGNDDSSDEFPVDAYVIRGTDFPFIAKSDVSTCPYRYHKVSNYTPRKLKENDIVLEISGGTAEQPVGRAVIITKGVLEQLNDKVICASFCKLIRPDYSKVTKYYFYQWLKYLYDTRIIERYQLQSTGIINFKFEYFLRKGPVLIPEKELMDLFEKNVKPMRDEIDVLAKKNVLLAKQRDSLLLKIMGGKLSVEGKEIV